MFVFPSFAFLLGFASLALSNPLVSSMPTITAAPRLQPRATTDESQFIGWFRWSTDDSSYQPWSCTGKSWVTSGTIANCCETTFLGWETECFDSSLITSCNSNTAYAASISYDCGTSTCRPDLVYSDSTSDQSALEYFQCATWPVLQVFQELPELGVAVDSNGNEITLTSSESESSTTSFTSTSSGAGPVSSSDARPGSSSSPSLASETSPAPAPATPQKEASKAWIAGVVIGVIALVAIAGLAYYLIRQCKQKDPQPAPPNPQMQFIPAQQQQNAWNGSYAFPAYAASSAPMQQHGNLAGVYGPAEKAVDERGSQSTNPATYPLYAYHGQPQAPTLHELPVSANVPNRQ